MCHCVVLLCLSILQCLFFFNDAPPTEIYTLSLHDALPIWGRRRRGQALQFAQDQLEGLRQVGGVESGGDRKSTRLNSSHMSISYAVFCLKKKNKKRLKTSSSMTFQYYQVLPCLEAAR